MNAASAIIRGDEQENEPLVHFCSCFRWKQKNGLRQRGSARYVSHPVGKHHILVIGKTP
jgi:hypothetical protein